jgi:fumarate reductase subunit D
LSFREKIAWAAFITTLLAWGSYFAVVITRAANGGTHDPMLFYLFLAATIGQAVMMTAVTTLIAILTPSEANAPRDERDRSIGRRANGAAYLAVLLAIVAVIVAMHVGLHGTNVIFALVGVFILGEAVRFGTQAIGYRIGG